MKEPVVFRSQNQDIIIEFQKEKVNRVFSFAKTDEEDRYLYTMIFKNILGSIIKVIQLSDCEMYILLDNIYNFIYTNSDNMSVSLSCKDSVGKSYIFVIDTDIIEPEIFAEYNSYQLSHTLSIKRKNIFKIYEHISESLVSVLSFEISNSIPEFANCIYEICIQGMDIPREQLSEITATNIGTLLKPDFLLGK